MTKSKKSNKTKFGQSPTEATRSVVQVQKVEKSFHANGNVIYHNAFFLRENEKIVVCAYVSDVDWNDVPNKYCIIYFEYENKYPLIGEFKMESNNEDDFEIWGFYPEHTVVQFIKLETGQISIPSVVYILSKEMTKGLNDAILTNDKRKRSKSDEPSSMSLNLRIMTYLNNNHILKLTLNS